MRFASSYQAFLVAGLGALLAVPVGFVPAAVFLLTDGAYRPTVFPWRVVLALVVAVPLVVALITNVASGLALRFRPVRVSTVALD